MVLSVNKMVMKTIALSELQEIFETYLNGNISDAKESVKKLSKQQNIIVDLLSDKLNSYPKGDFGMVEESVRVSDEFREVKNNFNKEFKKLGEINRLGMKLFKKEIYKAHESKRQGERQTGGTNEQAI